MDILIVVLIVVFSVQIGLFIYSKRFKKISKKDDILLKYNISSRSDLFQILSNGKLPQEDVAKLQKLYEESAI